MGLAPLLLVVSTLPMRPPAQPLRPGPQPAPPAAPTPAPDDEAVLTAAHLAADGPGLLQFFRSRTPPAPAADRLAELIRQLGDKSEAVRDRAAGELVGLGPCAVPALRRAANGFESPPAARARSCLLAIEGPAGSQLVVTAARLLARRKPAGAAEALLAYLPFADDDHVLQVVEEALAAVGRRDGQPDPALLVALRDPSPVRRGTAARVLCGLGADRAAVRPLLKDPRPTVRLRAALGLAGAYDAEAIPVLIDLVGELPASRRHEAEGYLRQAAGEWAVTGPAGNDALSRRLRRAAWDAWWRQTDGPTLLEELRSRTLSDAERDEVLALIGKLDDVSAEARQKASDGLVAFGPRAAPLLRQAVRRGQPRVAEAAGKCLEEVERDGPNPLPAAAPRLLAMRKPPGAAEALVAYLPFAEEGVAERVVDALAGAGCAGGKADPALVRALADKVAVRRAGAAEALCKGRATEQLPAVRKLLQDPDAAVRFRTAMVLASLRHEKEAVPVLIALLKDLPMERAWEAEDALLRLADETAPAVALAEGAAARDRCVEAWRAWWRANAAKADLARLSSDGSERGLLVVENYNQATRTGRVLELGPGGKVRWEVGGLQLPQDAHTLPGGTILVVEQNNRVSVRDRQGRALWNQPFPNVFAAQKLRDGHTFVACRQSLLVVDRAGKQLFNHPCPGVTVLAARRFPDGQTAYVTYQGNYVRLDAAGKQVKTFSLPITHLGPSGADVAPGDRVVVSAQGLNKVIAYDENGKQAWEAAVTSPLAPYRLRNGHTLVPSMVSNQITELGPDGKVIREMKNLPVRPFRVSAR
jgi:HEAT repeat protein